MLPLITTGDTRLSEGMISLDIAVKNWIQTHFARRAENGRLHNWRFAKPIRFLCGGYYSAVFSLLLALLFVPQAHLAASVINAASASRADVGVAVAAAADGDTVTIPAGMAEWTQSLALTKGI